MDLDRIEVPRDVVEKVPASFAVTYHVCPVRFEAGTLVVAMVDPGNAAVLDDLRFMLNLEVRGVAASLAAILRALKRYYPDVDRGFRADLIAAGFTLADPEPAAARADELRLTPPGDLPAQVFDVALLCRDVQRAQRAQAEQLARLEALLRRVWVTGVVGLVGLSGLALATAGWR